MASSSLLYSEGVATDRISLKRFVEVVCSGPARIFCLPRKGRLQVGYDADFVIFEKDPHDVDPDQIKHIKVVRTVVGGRTMHPRVSS